MAHIIGVPSSRVSNAFTQNRLLSQVMADQTALYRTELQLATGRKYDLPSENPLSAMRIMDLQRLLEQKAQVQQNVELGSSYMELTDETLMSVNDLLIEARAIGNANVGTTISEEERLSASAQLTQITSQLLDASNTNANGRYLFAGTTSGIPPYEITDAGYIKYVGNEVELSSYCDIETLFQTNLPGSEVFGGVSNAVEGNIDVNPNLTFETRLSDLNEGDGIPKGSFQISNGTNSSVIDISNCVTIGDVAELIQANPPKGTSAQVEISPEGLRIRLEPDSGFTGTNLKITEIASGTTAAELGILCETPIGTNWLEGNDLDPILRATTSLDQAFGTYAQNVYHSSNDSGNIIFTADDIGAGSNGIQVVIENTVGLPGAETVAWDEDTQTLTIGICAGKSTSAQVAAAVNAAAVPISASVDPIEGDKAGKGIVAVTDPASPLTLEGGSGTAFDKSGLQIVNDGQTHTISFATAESFQDVMNILNASDAGVRATINEDGTGLDIHTIVSGCDFMIGENSGSTATQLGVRTFDESVYLSELNNGFGVEIRDDCADFSITLSDGTVLDIDLAHKLDVDGNPLSDDQPAQTVQDVLDIINRNPNNVMLDSDGNPVTDADGNPVRKLVAQMPDTGNGIELVDRTFGTEGMTITKNILSSAAWDLGILPENQDTIAVDSTTTVGQGTAMPSGNDNDISFSATQPGYFGDFTINYELLPAPTDPADVQPTASLDFDLASREMTFYINPTTTLAGPPATTFAGTTANEIISLLEADPDASQYFEATNVSASTGDGAICPDSTAAEWADGSFTTEMASGFAFSYTGEDTNPQEAEGVFNALIRLQSCIETSDNLGIQHALEQLEEAFTQFTFAHADLGAREQGLDILSARLQSEDLELESLLSTEADADYAEIASDLMAQQAAYNASLKAMSTNFGMSLLDYI